MFKVKVLVLVIFLASLSLVVPANAVEDSVSTEGTNSVVEPEVTTEATEVIEEPEVDKSVGREDRIKAYQEKKAEKLATTQAKRIASRCSAAQGKITSLRARITNVVSNRKKVYSEIGDKLDNLIVKFQAAGLVTTEIETIREDIKTELSELSTSLDSYDTVLSDLESMDCVSDPDAFYNALSEAREVQTALRDQATEFRRFATSELKTAIKNLRDQLEQSQIPETTDQEG